MEDLIGDCVHCGFCLPTCPTYDLWSEEMDSPRGRIVLMKELAEDRVTPELVTHLDNCLGCMSCVTACPSGVRYDLLVNQARAKVETLHTRPRLERWKRRAIFATFPYHRRLSLAKPFLPLAPLARRLPLARLAPSRPPRVSVPEVVGSGPRVGFLLGCVQRAYFPHVNAASVALLVRAGYSVYSPASLNCCGSLELHAGEADRARARAMDVAEAFRDVDLIVTNAAGCGSGLKEYPELADKVRDITEVLEPGDWPRLDLRVAYHDACHLAHAQGVRDQPRELLRRVVEVVEPAEWEICCGSAGIYNITHPDTAVELGRRKAQNLLETGADAIAAANPGCTLQIQAHLRELGHPLPVYHPAELLYRAISGGRE